MALSIRRRRSPAPDILASLAILACLLGLPSPALPQESAPPAGRPAPAAQRAGEPRNPLRSLVEEAIRNSPLTVAARSHWQAQTKVPVQASTLPDPQVQFQHFSVGGPAPLEGYETSDFFYTGFGASQDVPGPGKLRLQGAIAGKEADYARHQYQAAERLAAEKVREEYFELFYLIKNLAVLDRTRDDLSRIEQITETRYRVGEGLQQDVVKAQLQITEILKEQEETRLLLGQHQAVLKAILGRDVDSHNVEIGEVEPSVLRLSASELRQLAGSASPEVQMEQSLEQRNEQALKLAHKGYIPDFSVGYMFQRTGPGRRDYYVLTLGAKIPLYFWRRQTPAIEQAALELGAVRAQLRARTLDVSADAESQLIAARTAERVMALYREGLIPQGQNSLEAAMAAYRVGKADFQTLLSAFIELLRLNQEYHRQLADHEIAVARIQQIVGDLR